MPKGVEKASNSSAALLLPPRRPSEKGPKGDQSFEHALKQARPRREVAAKHRTEPKTRPEEDPAVSDSEAKPEVAAVETTAEPTAPSETDAPPDAEHIDKHQSETKEDVIADPASILAQQPPADIPVIPVPLVPEQLETTAAANQADVASCAVSADATPIKAAAAKTPPVAPAKPTQAKESDDGSDEPLALANADAILEELVPESLKDLEHPASPIRLPNLNEQAAPTEDAQASSVDTSMPTIAPVDPIDADSDEGATQTQTPKHKAAQLVLQDSEPDAELAGQPISSTEVHPAHDSTAQTIASRMIEVPEAKSPAPVSTPAAAPPAPAPVNLDRDFALTNHEKIVSSVRSQLLPSGGTMLIRLDPPELGALQIHVRMVDGVMNASFETSNEQATRLLSHSLSQLKSALETQGVSVDRIQVQQTPRDQQTASSNEDQQRQSQQPDSQAQREQQRRELMNRMWQRMRIGRDPLDMVA